MGGLALLKETQASSNAELQKLCEGAREHCERLYADFGQGGATQQGGFRQRMFHDISDCHALYEAERVAHRR